MINVNITEKFYTAFQFGVLFPTLALYSKSYQIFDRIFASSEKQDVVPTNEKFSCNPITEENRETVLLALGVGLATAGIFQFCSQKISHLNEHQITALALSYFLANASCAALPFTENSVVVENAFNITLTAGLLSGTTKLIDNIRNRISLTPFLNFFNVLPHTYKDNGTAHKITNLASEEIDSSLQKKASTKPETTLGIFSFSMPSSLIAWLKKDSSSEEGGHPSENSDGTGFKNPPPLPIEKKGEQDTAQELEDSDSSSKEENSKKGTNVVDGSSPDSAEGETPSLLPTPMEQKGEKSDKSSPDSAEGETPSLLPTPMEQKGEKSDKSSPDSAEEKSPSLLLKEMEERIQPAQQEEQELMNLEVKNTRSGSSASSSAESNSSSSEEDETEGYR